MFPDNPLNPAKSNVVTGVITINDSVWRQLSPIEREYWLAHEEGHIRNMFGSEVDADTYAFRKIAGSQKYSLRDIRRSLRKIIATNPKAPEARARLRNNAQLSLEFASDRGSELAKQILNKQTTKQIMTTSIVKPIKATPLPVVTQNKPVVVATTTKPAVTKSVSTPTTVATRVVATSSVSPMATKDITTTPIFDSSSNVISSSSTLLSSDTNNVILPVTTGNVIYSAKLTPVEETIESSVEELEVVAPQKVSRAPQREEEPQEEIKTTNAEKTTPKKKNNKAIWVLVAAVALVVCYIIYKSKKTSIWTKSN